MAVEGRTGRLLKKRITNAVLTILLIWSLFPVYWMIVTSVKSNRDIYTQPGLFPVAPVATHYRTTLFETHFLTFMRNSFLVAVATTAASILIGSLAAYAITRLRFVGRRWVARSIIFVYLVPPALLFIPLFAVVHALGLADTIYSLMLTYLTFTVPFCTWLLIGYFKTIPVEIAEAALVDGCGPTGTLWRIIVPLALPAMAVVALFSYTLSWNEFLYAMVFVGSDSQKTLTVGLAGLIMGDVFMWGQLMAASVLGSMPPVLIYAVSQRWVVSGLAVGGVKG
ncbi:MAG TPA: carbohydrate ABC transporter permease [Candidatus Methylomirabilis sp.]|nr:carbohydrate ABC transporter permease [Candidatus Methylomirabilis sp.]